MCLNTTGGFFIIYLKKKLKVMHFWSNIFNMKILNLWKYFDSNVPLSTFILTCLQNHLTYLCKLETTLE